MQIKAIDAIRDHYNGRDYIAEPGDTITVPDELGQNWVGNGWAEDTSGTVPTGERSSRPVTLSPQNVVSGQATQA